MTWGRTVCTVRSRPVRSTRSPHRPVPPWRSSATSSPSGASAHCNSQPTWPLLPSRRIFISAVLFLHPVPVGPGLHMRHPLRIGQVPLHRLADAALEGLGRLPAELALELARIDG